MRVWMKNESSDEEHESRHLYPVFIIQVPFFGCKHLIHPVPYVQARGNFYTGKNPGKIPIFPLPPKKGSGCTC